MSEHRADEPYDLFVIGGGSGGVRAARIAATLGARVALAEESRLGGTCVNVGCVPKKLLHYGARIAHELDEAAGFGWAIESARHDWRTLVANKDAEIARLNGIYRRLLVDAGVTIIEGRAHLESASSVRVGDRSYAAKNVLVATGGWAKRPSLPGAELAMVSDDCFVLPEVPRSIVIVGAGYIGLEFAGIFRALGAEVTLVGRAERVLNHFDEDIGRFVGRELAKSGIRMILGQSVARIERRSDALLACLDDGSEIEAEKVMLAVGRAPLSEGMGLERLGVRMREDGAIMVDEHFRTNVRNVFAVGDVIGHVQLTPVALAEGTAVAHTLFGGQGPRSVDYDTIPTAVFSMPPCASVGLGEGEAKRRGWKLRIFESEFRPLKHTLSGSEERMMMKLVVCAESDRVLGVHVVGHEAGEIVQGFAVALKCGATKAQLDATIGIHPTSAEELVTMRKPVR